MEYLIYDIKCLVFAILIITLYLIFDKKTNKIQLIDILIIIILVVISGIRCNFGSDMFNYYNQYNNVTYNYRNLGDVFNSSYQSGFITLCYIVYQLTNFEFGIFWSIALITYPVIVIYARKKTQRPSLVIASYILMGFFVMSNNILKQNIAMTLLLIAYYSFLKKKKYIRYAILIFIASKFHITALVVGILIIFTTKISPTYKNFGKFVLLGVIICILYNFVLPLIITNIPILSRYEGYLYLERSTSTIIRGTLNIISYIIMYVILTLIFLHEKEKIKAIDERDNYGYEQISFLFIAIMISIVAIRNQAINRIALYLYQFIIFMIPNLFKIKYSYRNKQAYLSLIVILIIGWFCLNNIIGAENRYYDYSTYFNDTPKSYY